MDMSSCNAYFNRQPVLILLIPICIAVIAIGCQPPGGSGVENLVAPQNVYTSTLSSSSIKIQWDLVPGAEGYFVYRGDSEDGEFTVITDTPWLVPPFTDNGLVADSDYWYIIAAWASGREHQPSVPCSGSTNLSVPTGIGATAPTRGEMEIVWDDLEGATSYNVYRSDSADGFYTRLNSIAIAGISYTDSGLADSLAYWYKVAALKNGLEQDRSGPVRGVTMIGPLSIRTVVFVDDGTLEISWDGHAAAEGYQLHRATDVDGPFTLITPSPMALSVFEDFGLPADTNYWYRANAIRDGIPQAPGTPARGITAPYWARTFTMNDDDTAITLETVGDGGMVIGGVTEVPYLADESWVLKVDSAGRIEWEKQYSVNSLRSLHSVSDGGYIMASNYWDVGLYDSDFALTKLSSSGSVLWSWRYGDASFRNDWVSDAVEASTGDYIAVGYNGHTNDAFFSKMNADGELLWTKSFEHSGSQRLNAICETSSGDFLAAGNRYTTETGYGGWIVKFDVDGVVEWQKAYDPSGGFWSIDEAHGGGFVLAGYSGSNLWVIGIDDDGTILWQKSYGRADDTEYRHISRTSDGNYIVSSCSRLLGPGFYNLWILKIDPVGNILWQVCYGANSAMDRAAQVGESAGGELTVLGTRSDRYWLLSLPQTGMLESADLMFMTTESAFSTDAVANNTEYNTANLVLETSVLATGSTNTTASVATQYP